MPNVRSQTGWIAAQAAVTAIAAIIAVAAAYFATSGVDTDRLNRIESRINSLEVIYQHYRQPPPGQEFQPRPWRNPGRIGSIESD